MSFDPRVITHKQNASTRKSSIREQNLRRADKQVRLKGEALKVVSKPSGLVLKEIRDFVDSKLKLKRFWMKNPKKLKPVDNNYELGRNYTRGDRCSKFNLILILFMLDYHCNTYNLISTNDLFIRE
jgi:hypothetical protein